MASPDCEDNNSISSNSSSEDELLSDLKIKICKSKISNEDSMDSGDQALLPQILVSVEVKELEPDSPPDIKKKRSKKHTELKHKQKKKYVPKKRMFPCHKCDAKFENGQELRTHALTHQTKTRHFCELCGRYFKKAFSLRLHRKVHESRVEKCPLCDLTFSLKVNLGRHMNSHERTESCKICPAKFHMKTQLADHMKIHNKQKLLEDPQSIGTPSVVSASTSEIFIKVEPFTNDEMDEYNDDSNEHVYHLNSKIEENSVTFSRTDLSHSTQTAIVSKMHKGRPVVDICRLYNVTPEVVNEIWEDRDNYSLPKKIGKRSTKYMNMILDKKIVDWFNDQRANDIQVSGKMLQDIAESFAKECGFIAFNGSKKWLDRFKKRYNILLTNTIRNRDYKNVTMESKWKNKFFKEQWWDASLGFTQEDIYNADEVGIYYNPSKGRIKKLAGKKYVHGYTKDRLSIFMCTNMTGSDKKRLLVCGVEDPLLHSYRNPDTLPVTYIRHSEAHFTTSIFEEYVKYWNSELQAQQKKAILILDRATIHSKLQLSNLKLVFVPWKASNGLIPVKNGVFAEFRNEFRRLIVIEKAMNAIRGIDRNMTCMEALNMFAKAWERTSVEAITKSFERTGYDVKGIEHERQIEKPKVLDNDDEMFAKMLADYDVEAYYTDLRSLDMYVTVDEELLTGQGTNGSVFGGNHKVIDPLNNIEKEREDILPIATDKPESDENERLVKKIRALDDLEIVRQFLQSNTTSYETYCTFMDIEKVLMQSPINFNI